MVDLPSISADFFTIAVLGLNPLGENRDLLACVDRLCDTFSMTQAWEKSLGHAVAVHPEVQLAAAEMKVTRDQHCALIEDRVQMRHNLEDLLKKVRSCTSNHSFPIRFSQDVLCDDIYGALNSLLQLNT